MSFRAAMRGEVIFTDGQGRPFEPPERLPGEPEYLFMRRYHAWRDSITACGNKAFDRAFRKALSATVRTGE